MRIFKLSTIKEKLIASIVVTYLFILIISLGGLYVYEMSRFKREISNQLWMLTQAIDESLKVAISFNDLVQISTLLNTFKVDQNIRFATVFDPDGKVLSRYMRDKNDNYENVQQMSPKDIPKTIINVNKIKFVKQ